MDGMHTLASPAYKASASTSSNAVKWTSEEHERLERLRRCASYASLGSFDGSDGDAEDWTFAPGAAAKGRLVENKGGLWALARRASDGAVFFGTQAGEVRAFAPGSEGAQPPRTPPPSPFGHVLSLSPCSLG